MTSKLKERCRVLQIQDTDWYIEAYVRACHRINHEEHRGRTNKLDRLHRQLQALYDQIVSRLEDEKRRDEQARAVAIGINHAVTDKRAPRELLKSYEKPKDCA